MVSQLQGYDLLPTIRMKYETKRYEFEKLHRPIGEYIDVPSPLSQAYFGRTHSTAILFLRTSVLLASANKSLVSF